MARLLLGIETSCDDTSAALVDESLRVAACTSASQIDLHAIYGGVVPEVASRAHLEAIVPVISSVMLEVGVHGRDLAGIAVTRGPGLIGALLVGISTAKALGLAWNVPVVGVNHLEGHLFSAGLDGDPIEFPALVLLVSGGHCLLAYAERRGDYTIIGNTSDDSVGEAYDKVSRLMGLGYPGGPVIDRLAKTGVDCFQFPRPLIGDGLRFSFSGLKSAVARFLESNPDAPVQDVSASFAAACMDVLVAKTSRAIDLHSPATVAVVGGVAASPILRERMHDLCAGRSCRLLFPPLRYATDNGAMIAAAGWWRLQNDGPTDIHFGARPNLRLGEV